MNFYIHIPFCRQKCPYCKFALTPVFDEVKKRRYFGYLRKEIESFFEQNPNENTNTIYFGGGTPSILRISETNELLDLFPQRKNAEISFECNPEDITEEYVAGLVDLGVNRISLGVQSLNNETLKAINRSDRESIFRALDAIGSGIGKLESSISVNIDFILGLPYSKVSETLENIQELHARFPFITHTSVYMLEAGIYPKEWAGQGISEKEMEEEYAKICEYFDSLGWHHYEISNWAKSGYECVHNQGYWNHTNYRGFGLSATSYDDQKRWMNSDSFIGYYRGTIKNQESLKKDQEEMEQIIHNLRIFRLDASLFKECDIMSLSETGWMEVKHGKIILTPAGIFRENFILSELIKE